MKPTAYIFDVDGTLADVRSIRHHVLHEPKNFDAFHEQSINVPPYQHVVDLLNKARSEGHQILIVTARRARWRNHTAMWLAFNNIHSDALFMRGDEDSRKDYEVKKDILETIRQAWTVVHAVDDNPRIIKLWEEEGIPNTIIDGWEKDS